MTKEKENEELQQKYVDLQILINQINQIQQQINAIQTQNVELRNLQLSLNDISNVKKDTEAYVPVGSNIFTKSKILDNKDFLVGVGSNVFVSKTLEETNSLIEAQMNELTKFLIELENQLNGLDLKGQELQKELIDKVK